jgi:hypothetical protein
MIACSLLLVLFIIEPWMFLTGLSLIYLMSIGVSIRRHRQLKAKPPAA